MKLHVEVFLCEKHLCPVAVQPGPESRGLFKSVSCFLLVVTREDIKGLHEVPLEGFNARGQLLIGRLHGELDPLHRLGEGVNQVGVTGDPCARGLLHLVHLLEKIFVELRSGLRQRLGKDLESLLIIKEEGSQVFHEVLLDPAVVTQKSHAVP